jgi:hypothetical protein
MAKLRSESEQQAYECRMRLLYQQLRQEGDPFARGGKHPELYTQGSDRDDSSQLKSELGSC